MCLSKRRDWTRELPSLGGVSGPGGGCLVPWRCLVLGCMFWGVPGPGVCLVPRRCLVQGNALSWGSGCLVPGWDVCGHPPTPVTAAAGGTHPTGLHSCNYNGLNGVRVGDFLLLKYQADSRGYFLILSSKLPWHSLSRTFLSNDLTN